MKIHRTPDGQVLIEVEHGDIPAEAYTHERPVGERYREPSYGRFWIEISQVAVAILGRHGRLLSQTKDAYAVEHPGHEVWFNACVFAADGTEIWFGDLDLTRESAKLQELANRLGTIYVTPECPYRWQGLPKPGRRGGAIRRFRRQGAGGNPRSRS